MMAVSWSTGLYVFLLVAFAGTLSVVEGIRCYKCGTYIVTSVTPCRNLSTSHLEECPPDAQFCSKYSNPAIQVYGCETQCEERVQNSFEIHCCNEDSCNGAESLQFSIWKIFFLPLMRMIVPTL